MLDLIARGRCDPDITSGPVALTKVSKVSVTGDEQYGGSCKILAPLATLPSLRTITTKFIFGHPTSLRSKDNLTWTYDQQMSGLAVLDLKSTYLSEASFSQLLGGIKGLRHFNYDLDGRDGGHYNGVPVRGIIDKLLEHTKSSLESVAFTGIYDNYFYSDEDVGSFKEFEVLEHIRIHSGYYLKNEDAYICYGGEMSFTEFCDDIQRLVDLLPASVRTVKIDGHVQTADMSSLLKGLAERKAESVPHLESINFMDFYMEDHDDDRLRAWARTWRKKLGKVGVTLIL